MKKGLIITLPQSDLVTTYLSVFSKKILTSCSEKDIPLKKLRAENANRENFEKSLNKLDYKFLVLNGHGSVNCITGHKEEPLLKIGENEELIKHRITYARSCFIAQGMQTVFSQESDGCFIGYLFPFMFMNNQTWSGNPSKDKIAGLFLNTSNLVPLGLLKGHSAKESSDNCKKAILKIIKNTIFSQDGDEKAIAEAMWNNYEAQVVLGNLDAKIVD
jgi:hypothetical protein